MSAAFPFNQCAMPAPAPGCVEASYGPQGPAGGRLTHAVIHAAVENQVAMGDQQTVSAVLEQLMREGLDRHEAVHCIGSVVAGQIHRALKHKTVGTDEEYREELSRLTAKSWKKLAP